MIDLYTCDTPNGKKVSIALEECGFVYNIHKVDIRKGEQHQPAYRKINPNQKIPAIVDHKGPSEKSIRVFETGAILQYLAGKSGRFLGNEEVTKLECLQWLTFIITGLAPNFVQLYHFNHQAPGLAEKTAVEYGQKRYAQEMQRLVGVLDFRLREFEFLGKTYTIADMAAYPWIERHEAFGLNLDDFVGVKNWFNRLSKRSAIVRGMGVPS